MQTGENAITVTSIHSALLFAVKYKFMTLRLKTTINSSTLSLSGLLHLTLAPFKCLTNCKDVPRSLNGESGRASNLVCKFDKQIARCNNSQINILNLFEFPHVLAA